MSHRGTLASALAALLLVAGLASFASAQTQAASVKLDVRVGFDGVVREATPAPIAVIVEADRFVAGSLQVVVRGLNAPIVLERGLDIPAGSRKEFQLVVPRTSDLVVRVVARDGAILASRSPTQTTIRNEELIGVVASAPTTVTRATIPTLARDVRVVPVPLWMADLGADALRSLSHLVVDAKAVAAFSPRQRDAVLVYAASGGELVVAAASEAALAFLPEPWRGSGRGDVRHTPAGNGRVTVALEPLSGAGWAANGPMWARTVRAADFRRWGGDATGGQEWLEAITGSGGFRRATLGWLLLFVLGYVALVGPLNFIVLGRMRRRELAWITVPAISLLFAGAAYVAGRGVRNVPIQQGAAVVVANASAVQESFGLAVLSRSGGRERLSFEGSWLIQPVPFEGGLEGQPVLRFARDRSDVDFDLAVGAVGAVSAQRVRLAGGGDAGALTARNGTYHGSVRNPFPVPLQDSAVYVGNSFLRLGRLEPRADATAAVPDRGGGVVGLEQPFFENGDPSVLGPGFNAIFPLLRRASLSAGVGDPGRAFLVGFADLAEVGPSLGIGRIPGTVLLAAPLRLSYEPGVRIAPSGIPRAIVGSDGFIEPNSPFQQVLEAREVTLRFDLPSPASAMTISTQDFMNLGGGGGFFKPLPGAVGGNGIQVLPPIAVPAPDIAVNGSITLSIYDFTKDSWRALDASRGRVELLTAAEMRRHVSNAGEVLVRVASDFPQVMPVGGIGLEAVLS